MAGEDNLNQTIVAWAGSRPLWEQTALGMLARGQAIDPPAIERLADIAQHQAAGTGTPMSPLTSDDLGSSAAAECVRVLGIRETHAVNALSFEDGITFEGVGLTLIYGHNGSGKSGYARVLKALTRARERTPVLGDIFAPAAQQSATVSIQVGDQSRTVHWPDDSSPELRQVSFYDSGCATRYVSTETEVAYRPWSLTLLDKLVGISAEVRSALEARRGELPQGPLSVEGIAQSTRAGRFVRELSASTTPLDFDVASEVPADARERLAGLSERIASLRSEDPEVRKVAIRQTIDALQTVRAALLDAHQQVSADRAASLKATVERAATARLAASQASELRFHGEPVDGIGHEAWMALWEAARRFSVEVAYPDKQFPHIHADASGPARCVLCQQVLEEDGQDRLERFEAFVTDETEDAAAAAEKDRDLALGTLAQSPMAARSVALAMQRLEAETVASEEVRRNAAALEDRRTALADAVAGGSWPAPADVPVSFEALDEVRRRMEGLLADLSGEDPSSQAQALEQEAAEIRSRLILADHRELIDRRVEELRARSELDEAIRLTDTRGITRRAAELTRSHVSDVMKHRFSQEALRLGLDRVRLGDAGGGQGNLRHRAQFVDAVQSAPVEDVLSEGEQTALGLAGFLTEVESDTSQSAVVFDDPVTSLDHVRQEKVAERLVKLASTRQVIVFTHDVGFIVDVKRAAATEGLPVTERHVHRSQDRPGCVESTGPWDGMSVSQRLAALEERLARLRGLESADRQAEEIRHWYQDLRLVWERALDEAVIGKVASRSKLELRPAGLGALARITDEDNREFQTRFTRCGDRGSHDRSPQLNRTVPPISELQEDLAALREWHRRVKRYE